MPIYEYRCKDKKCDPVTEIIRSIREADEPQPCKKCKGKTQKMVSQTSFSLQGGGWASDGYGS